MATEQNIFGDIPITVSSACSLQFLLSGRHSYSNLSGSKPWQLAIYVDGTVYGYTGGSGAITDTPNLQAIAPGISAGNHTVRCTWFGNSDMKFSGAVMYLNAFYK